MSSWVRVKIDVRFRDIDMMGHVNNAVYLSYFEQARIEWFKEVIGTSWDWQKQGLILARNEVDYLKPVFLHDEFYIDLKIGDRGTKSFTYTYIGIKKINGEEVEVLRGKSVLVCYDHHKNKSIPIPKEWMVYF